MRRSLLGSVFPALAFLIVIPNLAFAQPKEFRAPEISGGAEASLLVPRTRDVFPFGTSPTRGPDPAGFIPGIGFLAYNFDDNLVETGVPFIPPDPCGAAGPDRLISVVNVGIECRDKVGNLIFRDSLRDFFLPLGPQTLGTLCFDPKVVYDHHAGRFVVVALERWLTSAGDPSNESRILVAVSTTAAPLSATAADWFFMAIDSKLNIGGVDHWADYPGFEVDGEAVYIALTMFPFSGAGSYQRLWIIDKGLGFGFYAGGPSAWSLHDPVPFGFYQMTLMPALVYGGAPGDGTFLVGYSSLTNGGPGGHEFVQLIRVQNPLAVPTFSGVLVDVGDIENVGGIYGFPPLPDAPQSGGPALIEVNDSRALDAVWRGGSIWATTTINPGPGYDLGSSGQATAHWFQLSPTALPPLVDQGNIGGEDITPATWTFFPSVAVNGNGDVKFGFAASASSIYAGAFMAGRAALDPPSTVQASAPVQVGFDYYLRTFGGPRNRWGDYSGASVDPADDLTFWIYNQYAEVRGTPTPFPPEDGRWGTAWRSCMSEGPPPVDWGDAPDLAAGFHTLNVNNGARHIIVPGVFMGNSIDGEPDGQPSVPATRDDNTGIDDEDGVFTAPIIPTSGNNTFTVTVSMDGWLDAWVDWNQNFSWADPGEHVISQSVVAGVNNLLYGAPTMNTTAVHARFRYNLNGPLAVDGSAPNGEVEDYLFQVRRLDFGDAYEPTYQTTAYNFGPRHLIVPGVYMGAGVDNEPDGQPHPNALGDDAAGVDDEDGVVFTTALDPTYTASVDVTVSVTGFVDAWIDFNSDAWLSPAEHVVSAAAVAGVNTYNFVVPGTSMPAHATLARFRFNTAGNLTAPSGGPEANGEVEDYEVIILQDTVTPVRDTPGEFALFDPVPNPFNPRTTLSFALPSASHVELSVYDVSGRLVATLLDENRPAGTHRVVWDGRNRAGERAASGVYLYRIQAGSFTDTKRMVLLK
jgi:hypothetical protein